MKTELKLKCDNDSLHSFKEYKEKNHCQFMGSLESSEYSGVLATGILQ